MAKARRPSAFQQWLSSDAYKTYKSPYGPSTKPPVNVFGIDLTRASRLGFAGASFGVAAGVFAIFFFSDVPKVRKDIMIKIPMVGYLFEKHIPPEDNVGLPRPG